MRQGDPLSTFLFNLAMEGIHITIQGAPYRSLIQVVNHPHSRHTISHLFYADDTIFYENWDIGSIKNLSRILKCFHISSGLKVNFHKSRLFGISVSNSELQSMAKILGCMKSSFPFTYLGVPVGGNMLLKNN